MEDNEAVGPVSEPFDRFRVRGMAELELLDEALIEVGEEHEAAIAGLAARLLADHGAPSLEAGRAAATEEIAFSAELAQHPVQTLVALHRTVTADGSVSEQFRTFRAAEAKAAVAMPCSAGAFAMVPDDDADAAAPSDDVDLAALVAANATGRAT